MSHRIGVVIPSYNVRDQVLDVLERIGPEVSAIYVVDDACPQGSGAFVQERCHDPRVTVLSHDRNTGVGGATITGYRRALDDGMEIVVKMDGDGQMDAALIPELVRPIVEGQADYVKGNRFFSPDSLRGMPWTRAFGNALVSFFSKASSGYWNLMDPANGQTAIDAGVLKTIPLEKVDRRYFFESDILFRLNIVGAVVRDIPARAIYRSETSNVSLGRASVEFPAKYLDRFVRRILYRYFLRDFNVCSIEIVFGLLLLGFGTGFGALHWARSISTGIEATTGTVILAALPFILGFQLLLAAISFDVMNIPSRPLHESLRSGH